MIWATILHCKFPAARTTPFFASRAQCHILLFRTSNKRSHTSYMRLLYAHRLPSSPQRQTVLGLTPAIRIARQTRAVSVTGDHDGTHGGLTTYWSAWTTKVLMRSFLKVLARQSVIFVRSSSKKLPLNLKLLGGADRCGTGVCRRSCPTQAAMASFGSCELSLTL